MVRALRPGESVGLYDLLEGALTVDSPDATAKTTCVVGGMLADADSIDDLEGLRESLLIAAGVAFAAAAANLRRGAAPRR